MGCVMDTTLNPIPPPEGPAQNPLQADGDIVLNIVSDPHINFFQNKIEEVLIPLRKRKKMAKEKNQIVKTGIQSYATSDKKQHEQYVKCLNSALQGNDNSTTNILAYMFDEMADFREGNKAKQFKNDTYAALKCFIFLYTGNYTYKKINSQLRRNEYEKISAVIAVVKKQLQQYNKEKFSRKLKANKKLGKILSLYRGIPKPDKQMVKGKKMYWKAFTSTSLQAKVANRFGKYNYIVQLDNKLPHEYMIVPEEMSQFKQEQIILFPYFYFECNQVEDFQSGARYECRQIMCQE